MPRVVRVLAAGKGAALPIDSVVLSGDQRRMQHSELTGVNGTQLALALSEPVMVRMGDTLELDDGTFVEVVVAPEPLVEIRGSDLAHLARIAWHLGDRHVPVQVLTNRLRMRRDHALEDMLTSLGARLTPIEAPFDPEGGAYATQPAHDHAHSHDHDHKHVHDHPHSHDHCHHAPGHHHRD